MLSPILRLYKKDGGRSFPAPRSYRAAKNSGAGAIMLPPQAHVASRQTTSTHSRKIWMAMPPMRRMRCTEAINRGTSDYKPPGRGMTTIRTLGPGLSVDPSGELAKPTLRHPGLSALAAWVAPHKHQMHQRQSPICLLRQRSRSLRMGLVGGAKAGKIADESVP